MPNKRHKQFTRNKSMLDKAIKHKKEYRKQFYGIQQWDKACRPNGKCKHCQNNRLHKHKRNMLSIEEQLDQLAA